MSMSSHAGPSKYALRRATTGLAIAAGATVVWGALVGAAASGPDHADAVQKNIVQTSNAHPHQMHTDTVHRMHRG
jgi:hypothetical protein